MTEKWKLLLKRILASPKQTAQIRSQQSIRRLHLHIFNMSSNTV